MNHHKVRLILAYIISFMPFNKLRCFFYNKALGYKVVNSYIGWATVMAVNYAEIIESSIGKGNKFIGPMKVIVNRNSNISGMNSSVCGWWIKDE